MTQTFDVVVVGAGMAGASLAAALSPTASVLLVESEERAGMRATGRSAALHAPGHGSGPIRILTLASKAVFHAAPPDSSASPFVTPRASLMVARAEQGARLEAILKAEPTTFDPVDAATAGETDVEPRDADDEALAEGVDRIARLTTIEVTRAPRAWAGPRAQAPFFRLAGQGGYGAQTAPAIAVLAANQSVGRPAPAFCDRALTDALSPARYR